MTDCVWLIVAQGSVPVYLSQYGDFCSNPQHAERFTTEDAAKRRGMTLRCPYRVEEHMWPAPGEPVE